MVVYFTEFIKHQLLQSFCLLDQTMESVYNTHRKFEGRFQEKKVRIIYTGKYGNTTVHEKDSERLKSKYKPLH